jgi:hypothetical protein
MSKKSAPMRDGWIWELFKDAASRTSSADLLKKIRGTLREWTPPEDLMDALILGDHDPLPQDRVNGTPFALRPKLTHDHHRRPANPILRKNCPTNVQKRIAESMLKFNQFSYGISGGVQHVILGCTVALQSNPMWILGVFDLRNAHTDCTRGLTWHELENDQYFHFLIQIFICMYGENRTPQWHFGNDPDQPSTSIHWSGDGLRQ